MDNPETHATLGTRHTTKDGITKLNSQKSKKMSNTDLTKNGDEPRCSRKHKKFLLLIV
jgi:hypothetical protein